jgi:hypothetical protein
MPLYLKKVEAVQFKLTDEQKELIRNRKPVFFEGSPVKFNGGQQYIAVLQFGENLIKIEESQWLVRDPDGGIHIYWPDRFGSIYIKGSEADSIHIDPHRAKPMNQPNTLL